MRENKNLQQKGAVKKRIQDVFSVVNHPNTPGRQRQLLTKELKLKER